MKKLLTVTLACLLACSFLACGVASRHPKTPTAVVQELFVRVGAFKEAQSAAKENESSEEAAKALAESKQAVGSLFVNPQKARLITMPLVFLDLEDVEFLDETIDGDSAEVTIEHTVVGIGKVVELKESAQKRSEMTFQLKKEDGRWLISDTGGILQKFGR
jgi:hypothetical protein